MRAPHVLGQSWRRSDEPPLQTVGESFGLSASRSRMPIARSKGGFLIAFFIPSLHDIARSLVQKEVLAESAFPLTASRTIPMNRARSYSEIVLIGVLTVVGFYFIPDVIDWIFYTTKTGNFLEGWMVLIFICLFTASLMTSSLATSIVLRRLPTSDRRSLLWFFSRWWIALILFITIAVRVFTAKFHHTNLSLPDWIIPTGLLLIPTFPAVVILCLAFRRVSR